MDHAQRNPSAVPAGPGAVGASVKRVCQRRITRTAPRCNVARRVQGGSAEDIVYDAAEAPSVLSVCTSNADRVYNTIHTYVYCDTVCVQISYIYLLETIPEDETAPHRTRTSMKVDGVACTFLCAFI